MEKIPLFCAPLASPPAPGLSTVFSNWESAHSVLGLWGNEVSLLLAFLNVHTEQQELFYLFELSINFNFQSKCVQTPIK